MKKCKVFLLTICFVFLAMPLTVNAAVKDISVSNSYVPLTYGTVGTNKYNYNGTAKVNCTSSNTNYVNCKVDSKNKKILLTPVNATNEQVNITVTAEDKQSYISTTASIKSDSGDSFSFSELKNPVIIDNVDTAEIKVPDTWSGTNTILTIAGICLAGLGVYFIIKKLKK